jgi:RHS repeat-associated protein
VLHYLHDVLGSVVALTNSAGQVVERYDYDPYGTTTIMDAAAMPLALKPIDPTAADGYYHDHDRDGDIDAADYTDLMDCVNNTPYDPMCIYTHDRTGDRRVDIVDVGVYLAYADDQGLAGGTSAPELVHYGRPLRLQFDADGDGRVDMFDWYAMQTCFTKNTTRCKYLFDDNGDNEVNFYDLANFKAAADGPQGGPGATQWRRKLVASRYGNPFMWTGQRYDATTGQYHFWARTYSPSLGRWMQRDPLEYVDGSNLYVYVRAQPTMSVDPLGLYDRRDRDGMWKREPNAEEKRWLNEIMDIIVEYWPVNQIIVIPYIYIGDAEGVDAKLLYEKKEVLLGGHGYILVDWSIIAFIRNLPDGMARNTLTLEELILYGGRGSLTWLVALLHEMYHVNLDPWARDPFKPHNPYSFVFEAYFLEWLSWQVNDPKVLKWIYNEFEKIREDLPPYYFWDHIQWWPFRFQFRPIQDGCGR